MIEVPDEYIDYILCDKFKCLPSQLDEEDDYVLDAFITIMSLENKEVEKQNRKLRRTNG